MTDMSCSEPKVMSSFQNTTEQFSKDQSKEQFSEEQFSEDQFKDESEDESEEQFSEDQSIDISDVDFTGLKKRFKQLLIEVNERFGQIHELDDEDLVEIVSLIEYYFEDYYCEYYDFHRRNRFSLDDDSCFNNRWIRLYKEQCRLLKKLEIYLHEH